MIQFSYATIIAVYAPTNPTSSTLEASVPSIEFHIQLQFIIASVPRKDHTLAISRYQVLGNYLISWDLQRCGLTDVWQDQAPNCKSWQCIIWECIARGNMEDEMREKQEWDEEATWKQTNGSWEGTSLCRAGLHIHSFKLSKLVNHQCQAHCLVAYM